MRLGAQLGRGWGTQRAAARGVRRWDRGPGDRLRLGVGGVGLWTPQGAARYRRVSPVLAAAGAGAATTCVPASWPGVGGGGPVCARSPRLRPGDPEAAVAGTQLSSARPAAAPRRPQSLQFLKVAEAAGGKGCAEGGEPTGPCRSAAAQPPPPGRPPGCRATYLWSGPLAARAGG